ncbi:MBL fold metallo-hydrolase [Crassaminicella profunda]|uniref:MBL fold metallo-hydrolase n=1 Tax=Crassaminicella profunda TaxID=1286698 RepID=UPI001CA70CC7|nr:MBL fold metallo-hydrolase [Crassaminicella profunda]QZY56935.1 MBL fold metallo-hydrolase [Crassaminicella profunda]
MKITTIIENSLGDNKELHNEHGLSFFIETPEGNILFDTGRTGDFIENAKALGIDLKKTDFLMLSHAHYDHCGGVRRFLEDFDVHPEFYVSENFFSNSDKYRSLDENKKSDFSADDVAYRYIGIDFNENFIKEKKLNINYVDKDMVKLGEKVYIFTNFERTYDFEGLNPNMKFKKENEYLLDRFEDEITLVVDTDKGLVILLGCSHPGLLNIIDTIAKRTGKNIYGIIGGTHLVEADEERIDKTIEKLKEKNIKIIGVSHCTGEKAVQSFKEKCDDFFVNCTGTILEV